jgi:hypothetical protein
MSFLGIGRKKGHVADDNARAMSLAVRRENAELKHMEWEIKKMDLELEKLRREADIQDLREDLGFDEEDDNSPENMFSQLIEKAFMAKFMSQGTPPVEAPKTLSDEEIKGLVDKIPKNTQKMIRSMSKEQAVKLAREQYPTLTEDTMNRAYDLIAS